MDLASVSYKRYSSAIGRAVVHLCFVPKYRHPVFAHGVVQRRCAELFREIAARYGMQIHELGFDIDHVHVLVDIGPGLSVAAAARLFKGISSRCLLRDLPWLRRWYFWGGHFWSPAYFFASVGPATYETVVRYVREQGQRGAALQVH